jgi:hypothetical protein
MLRWLRRKWYDVGLEPWVRRWQHIHAGKVGAEEGQKHPVPLRLEQEILLLNFGFTLLI